MPGFAVVIPAAGGSQRLGRPKQLVEFQGETLIRRAVRIAVQSGAGQVIVVLGAEAPAVWLEAGRDDFANVESVENPTWEEGMAGSIRTGVEKVRPEMEAVVILLSDTPLVTPDQVKRLVAALGGQITMAASQFDEVLGPPCAFARSEFPRLLALEGDAGARALLRDQVGVAHLESEEGRLDVDTPADLERLTSLEGHESP